MGSPVLQIYGAQPNLGRVVEVCLDGNRRCFQLRFAAAADTSLPSPAHMTPLNYPHLCRSSDPMIDCLVDQDDDSLFLALFDMAEQDVGGGEAGVEPYRFLKCRYRPIGTPGPHAYRTQRETSIRIPSVEIDRA